MATELNILVPAGGIGESRGLVSLAGALLEHYGGEGTVLSVVEVPEDRSLSEAAVLARRRRNLLRRLSELHPNEELRPEVVAARTLAAGIRDACLETSADLLLLSWNPNSQTRGISALEDIVKDPPCDLVMVKPGARREIESVLLPVRGGPHAELALKVAEALAARNSSTLTLLHVVVPRWDDLRRAKEERNFSAVVDRVRYGNVREVRVESETIEDCLMRYGAEHDAVVMGASARDVLSGYLVGRLSAAIARNLESSVFVVKTGEPVTRSTFGVLAAPAQLVSNRDVSEVVDRWFAENTYHSHEFRNLRYLVDLKERQGRTISLALPTLNEEKTVGRILATLQKQLIERYPLIDELVVIDSGSRDRTVEIVSSFGVPIYQHPDILAAEGSFTGKGEALWKSLAVTSGDIVVWVDSDITGFHPKFVYGLIGPLLTEPDLAFVKGFYRRPLNLPGQRLTTGGGRVTELTARPLINLFYPELSGVVQPLAGEMAGRRDVLESVPFFTGYGVETGLLIDILEGYGLRSIAQTDLEERVHRNQTLLSLSKMAFAIVQVVIQRMGDRRRLALLEDVNTSMKLIHYSPTELFLEVKEIEEHERPPIKTVAEYSRVRVPNLAAAAADAGQMQDQ